MSATQQSEPEQLREMSRRVEAIHSNVWDRMRELGESFEEEGWYCAETVDILWERMEALVEVVRAIAEATLNYNLHYFYNPPGPSKPLRWR